VSDLAVTAPTMTDPAQRAEAYARVQAIIAEDTPSIPLFYSNNHTTASVHVRDFAILFTGTLQLWETRREDV
jgi:ABC-type transport system substrate-binding protein